jgi:hypothetical protein
MASETYSYSYTVADIGKVLDNFAADFDMIAQSTGLRTREDVRETSADVKLMAEYGYLSVVNLYLRDAGGTIIRAAKYEVNTNGGGLAASRPGNSLWPRTAGGTLCVYVEYNSAWSSLSDLQRSNFRARLQRPWGSYSLDTSFPRLVRQSDRNYVSNGYALQKSAYT